MRTRTLGRMVAWVVVLGLAGGGAWWWWHNSDAATTTTAERGTTNRRGGGGRRGGNNPDEVIPVAAARSARADVPVWLDGLGTVQAFNTANIKAQVDGPLVEVRFKEGQDVKAGDVLARIDPRPFQATLDQQLAKKQQDEANLANARADAARYAKLAGSAYASAQQYDTARATAAQLEAQVRGDQALVDSARVQLGYTTITAPFDGRTGIRQVDVGNIVHSSDTTPLTVVTQLHPISVVFTLPQQNLGAVAAAMGDGKAPVVEAVSQGGTRKVLDQGILAVLDNQVDPATGTIKLKATFPNPGLTLWPGGFVNVRLRVGTLENVVTVPTSAVQRGPRGSYVYVVKNDNTADRRDVGVGHEDEQVSVLQTGLDAGEQVVVDGASRLTQDSKVAVAGPDGTAPAVNTPVARERRAPGTAGRRSAS